MLALFLRPFFPPLIIAAAAVLALLALGWRHRRAPAGAARGALYTGTALRVLAVAGLAALLLGPSVVPPADTAFSRSRLSLLVDVSGSMQTADVPDDPVADRSRYAFARDVWLDPALLAELGEHHDVSVYRMGDALRAGLRPDDTADDRTSLIAAAVQEAINALPAANADGDGGGSVVVLSDGRDASRRAAETAAAAARLARARGVAVFGVPLGGATLSRDLALGAAPRQPFLMINEPGQLDVWIDHVHAAGRAATLRLRDVAAGTTTDHAVAFGDRGRTELQLPLAQSEPGLYEYELSVDPLPGEADADNNRQTVLVEVTDQRMRVLLLEGRPFWDTKFIAQTLRRDDRIELTQITQISADRQERILTRTEGTTAAAPATYDELCAYDLILLGRGVQDVLPVAAAAALPRYVNERGGRVVFTRGAAADGGDPALLEALTTLSPVDHPLVIASSGVTAPPGFHLTATGRTHPVFAALMAATAQNPQPADLPQITPDDPRSSATVKPGTRVLATFDPNDSDDANPTQHPAITLMPYGRGTVAAVLGEGFWRWRMAGTRDPALGGVYEAFWSTLTRWLVFGGDGAPGDEVALRLSTRSLAVDDELIVTLIRQNAAPDPAAGEATAAAPALRVTAPDGTVTPATALPAAGGSGRPGRRSFAFSPKQPGVHTVSYVSGAGDDRLETRFVAYDDNAERRFTAADPATLAALSGAGGSATGGTTLDPHRPRALLEHLARQRALRAVPPRAVYVWDRGWVMVLLLGAAGVAWILHKKGGLL